MKITFVLPGYPYKPVGGFRIVYLYANYFAQQGHQVSVVHGLKRGSLREPPPMWPKSLRIGWRKILYTTRAFNPPKVRWQSVDTRVKL
ncbi:MAG: glycosyl transferase family 1, partial [Firmicutes bacterium]|nr:glycosyl transferase family 1 [Bacillota bacterium]